MSVPRDPDSSLEELLRTAMRGEADSISPAGDGLARIQQRVAARRSQRLWLRPVAVVGAAAFAGGAGFTAYALTAHPDTSDSVAIKPGPTASPTLSASPTSSPTPTTSAAPGFPGTAFYPFTSAAAEVSWEAQKGPSAQPWITDPVAEAKEFIAKFVLADGVTDVIDKHVGARTASVTLGRTLADGSSQRTVGVTTVQLQRFGKAWLVLGARDATGYLKVASPAAGDSITSPVTVSGPGFGADEAVDVDVRAIGAPFLTATRGHSQFGNGVPNWSTTVSFGPAADVRGAVVAIENSAADGGASRITVVGVNFADTSAGYPAYFYGVKNDRVTKFSARTGAAISYLTAPAAGTVSDPQLVGDRVYYLSGVGTCVGAIKSVPLAGGSPTTVATADPGYGITGFGVSDPKVNTFYENACVPGASPQARLVVNTTVGDTHQATTRTDFPSVPPGVVADPTWDADGQHFDAILATGTQAQLARYDGYNPPTAPGDNVAACAGFGAADRQPLAAQFDANGYLWVATRSGSSIDVVRCVGSTARVMFSVAGNRAPADVDVAGGGDAVLVTDTDGHVWRWTMGGNVEQLSPSVPVSHLTW